MKIFMLHVDLTLPTDTATQTLEFTKHTNDRRICLRWDY